MSTCNIEKSFVLMMNIETMSCFLTTQLIILSNNLKIYFSMFFRSRSFATNVLIIFSKICLSLFFLFNDVFLFNFEFNVDDIFFFNFSLFELEIWLLSFFFLSSNNVLLKIWWHANILCNDMLFLNISNQN